MLPAWPPLPPHTWHQQRCDYYRSATLSTHSAWTGWTPVPSPPWGRVQTSVWGYQAMPATPHLCGDPLGGNHTNHQVPLVCPPVGHTSLGHKTIHKSKKFRPKISCSLQLWGGRIYQPENFLNITTVVSELLF